MRASPENTPRHLGLLFAVIAAVGSAWAQFTPTGVGPYNYGTTTNWTSGTVNGQLTQTLASGSQTITFAANTTLPSGLTINLNGTNPALTLLSDGTGNRTVTLGADVSVNGAANSSVTIGSTATNAHLDFVLGGNRTFTVGSGRSLTLANDVTGTFNRLTKAGSGTLILTGTASYTGGTVVSGGVLQVGAGGTTGSLTGNITDNASVVFNRSNDLTFTGDISGMGQFTKLGAGTLTLTGDISAWVHTIVSSGTLQFTFGGSVSGDVVNNGSIVFNRSYDLTYGGDMSGSGSLTKLGNATLTLTGNNNYTGGTTVSDGILEVGDTNALPTNGAVTVASGAVLDIDHSQTLGSVAGAGSVQIADHSRLTVSGNTTSTFSGTISEDGGLTLSGNGSLTLSGANTYSGGTTITGGTLIAANAFGSATGTGTVTVSGGTLQIGTGGTTGAISGNITDNAHVVFNRSNSFTYGGDISGNGTLTKLGTGTLTLTGDISTSVHAVVSAGTLQFSGAGSVSGDVVNNASVVFNRSDDHDYYHEHDFTYGGNISGSGTLTKLGNTTLILTGNNSYTGGTTVSDGTLRIGDTNALPVAGPVSVAFGALLDVDHSQTIGALTGVGAVTIGNFHRLTLTGKDSSSFSGVISDFGGLTFSGSGSLTLSGSNTYRGGTTITSGTLIAANTFGSATGTGTVTVSGGTLQVGTGGTSGAISGDITITNNASVVFNRSSSLTYGGDINGTGSLTKLGAGRLTLTGHNHYTGTTTVNGGTLSVGVANTLPTTTQLALASGAILDVQHSQTVAGFLTSSTGAVLQLTAGATFTVAMPVADTSTTFAGSVTGAGTFAVNGAGNDVVHLTGSVASTVGTQIGPGATLVIGSGGVFSGPITNTGTLSFCHPVSQTLTSVICGEGGLLITAGTTTLTAANLYHGPTVITGGKLLLTNTTGTSGTGTGIVTVSSGGIFGGSGFITGNLVLNSGGTVSPGLSPGTLTVGNTFWLGGALFNFEINDADVTRAPGTTWDLLSISGALTVTSTTASPFTVNLVSLTAGNVAGPAANFNATQPYSWQFVSTTGGVNGFTSPGMIAVNPGAFLNSYNGIFAVSQAGNNLMLNYTPAAIPEPTTWTLLMAGIGAVALCLRRRK